MPTKKKKREQRSPAVLDALRARALRGDRLEHSSDSEREWVWRSLLLGVRLDQAARLAGLSSEQVERALVRIRRLYQAHIDAYKRDKARQVQAPRVIRPVVSSTPTLKRRWRLFGKRG